MVLLCAGKSIFRYLGKFQENSGKIHAPEASTSQKWGQREATGDPGALLARPPPWPGQEAAWGPPPSSGALPRLVFIPVMGKPQNRSRFLSFHRGASATLCSSSGG